MNTIHRRLLEDDPTLKQHMLDHVPANPAAGALSALEDRVLAQWALRDHRQLADQRVSVSDVLLMGAGQRAPSGPLWHWLLGAALAVASLTLTLTWQAHLLDTSAHELAELDVLSLIAEGAL